MSEENIAFRLKFLLQNLGITSSSFADECGISRATFSQLLTGRNKKISDVLIGQIHSAYPALSILWLLFNEGPMWIGQPGDLVPGNGLDKEDHVTNDEGKPRSDGFAGGDNDAVRVTHPDNGTLFGDKEEVFPFTGVNYVNSGSQNPKIPNDGQEKKKYPKENALNYTSEQDQRDGSESINNCIKTTDFLSEIEKNWRKPRKVVQVTIYYDDSTFETLFPRTHGDQNS